METIRNVARQARRLIFPSWLDYWQRITHVGSGDLVLQLGSGVATKKDGMINADINISTTPSLVCDFNVSIPLKSNSVNRVLAISVLEHLDDVVSTLEEIHRVTVAGGQVIILVPHFSSSGCFVDPTHKQALSARSLDYFISGTKIEREFGFYSPIRFRKIKSLVSLHGIWSFFPPARWLANRYVTLWEDNLAFLIRGEGIFWVLEVEK